MKRVFLLIFLISFSYSTFAISKTLSRIEAIYNEDNTKQSVFYENVLSESYYEKINSIIKKNIDLICYYNDGTKEVLNDGETISLEYGDVYIGLNEIKVFYSNCMTRIAVPISNQKENFKFSNIDEKDISDKNTGIKITGMTNNRSENSIVIVPKYIDGIQVRIIGNSAFANFDYLKELHLPRDLVSIEEKAFTECWSLEKIRIPDTVVTIGKEAFSRCSHLKEVNLSNAMRSISEETFAYCYDLETIYLPESIKNIGKKAFYSCYYLKNIVSSNFIEVIDSQAFYECERLSRIFLPYSKYIGYQAFKKCVNLDDVIISCLTTLEDEVFYDINQDINFTLYADEGTPLYKFTIFENYIKRTSNIQDINFTY